MRLKNITDQQILESAETNHSYAAIMRHLNIRPSEGNWRSLKIRVSSLQLDTSQWKGIRHGRGGNKAKPLVLDKNTPLSSTDRFKKQLIKKGILHNKCAICNRSPFWESKPLSLQLDHVDGDRNNQTITNLRLLCPNCHSQTDNFAGKALRKPREKCPTLDCPNILSKGAKICFKCRFI